MQGNRRDFLKGCCAAAMAAGSGSTMAFFDPLALAGGKSAASGDVLFYVFLRGAIDGLHLLTALGVEADVIHLPFLTRAESAADVVREMGQYVARAS